MPKLGWLVYDDADAELAVLRGLPVEARRGAHLQAAHVEVAAPFLQRSGAVDDVVRAVGVAGARVGEARPDDADARAEAEARLVEAVREGRRLVERRRARGDGRPALRPVVGARVDGGAAGELLVLAPGGLPAERDVRRDAEAEVRAAEVGHEADVGRAEHVEEVRLAGVCRGVGRRIGRARSGVRLGRGSPVVVERARRHDAVERQLRPAHPRHRRRIEVDRVGVPERGVALVTPELVRQETRRAGASFRHEQGHGEGPEGQQACWHEQARF